MRLQAFAASIILLSQSVGAAEVVVQKGDTLSSIAAAKLGDSSLWTEICEANSAVLKGNCDLVTAGTKLTIQDASKAAPVQQPPVATANEPPAAKAEEPAVVKADVPVAAKASEPIAVSQIPAEGLEVVADGELFSGKMLAGDVHRARFGFQGTKAALAHVEWPIEASASSTVLIFSQKRQVIGRIDGLAGDLRSDGAVEDAALTGRDDGLKTLSFSVPLVEGEGTVQLLYYPYGTSGTPTDSVVKFGTPTVSALSD